MVSKPHFHWTHFFSFFFGKIVGTTPPTAQFSLNERINWLDWLRKGKRIDNNNRKKIKKRNAQVPYQGGGGGGPPPVAA